MIKIELIAWWGSKNFGKALKNMEIQIIKD